MAKESVMNFYERAASLLEQDVGTPSGGDSPAERARKQKEKEGGGAIMQKPPPGHSAADKAKAQRDKERGITASNKPGGKKKKDNGDVDEWGSADAVAQKDKRQADRKEKTGQTTVPHKHGRPDQLGGVKFSDKEKAKYSPEAKAKQQAKDDAALNASKKGKVKEVFSDDHLDKVEKEVGVTPAQSAAAKEKVKKEREAEKALNSSKKSKVKESFYERVTLLNEIGRAETDAEAGAYSGGAKRPASRAGRATDGGDQTSQEQENRRKEQQADIERSTGVKLNSSKRSKGKV